MQVFNIEVVYKKHQNLVCSIVKKYIKNSSDVEECVSDIFLKAYLRKNQYNSKKGNLSSWLAIISKNHCIDFIRKQNNYVQFVDDSIFSYINIVEIDYDDNIDSLVNTCLSLANEDERKLLQLFYFENKKHREIAEIIGVNTNAVGTMIKRSTTKIAKRITTPINDYKMAS